MITLLTGDVSTFISNVNEEWDWGRGGGGI